MQIMCSSFSVLSVLVTTIYLFQISESHCIGYKERKVLHERCEKYDDDEEACKRDKACVWVGIPDMKQTAILCDNYLAYNEVTSIISNIYAGSVFAANELFRTDTADGFSDYMAAHCSDDFYYEATINTVANEKITTVVWNNLDEYLYSGNSELNLDPHPLMLLYGSTRRTISNSNLIFQCVEEDDDEYQNNQIIASSYYAVRIQKKETLETDVVINYVKTYWRYSHQQQRWLWTKAIFQTINPFTLNSEP